MGESRIQIVIGVPGSHLDAVLEALASAGAGEIGNYTHCSYAVIGTGRYKPNVRANPAVGERDVINTVEEYRIETICERSRVKEVIRAVRAAHPYEEPLLYLLPLLDEADFT